MSPSFVRKYVLLLEGQTDTTFEIFINFGSKTKFSIFQFMSQSTAIIETPAVNQSIGCQSK